MIHQVGRNRSAGRIVKTNNRTKIISHVLEVGFQLSLYPSKFLHCLLGRGCSVYGRIDAFCGLAAVMITFGFSR
jgi:hypothetical protein